MDNICTPPEKLGKKLVQARLPFKVLSSTEKNELVLNSSEKVKSIDSNVDSESKSKDSKEEIPEKKIKLVTEEVVILSDNDDEDNKKESIKDEDLLENHSNNLDKQSRTPDQKSTKVFIKLPISSKKKKRKSLTSDESIDNAETVKYSTINEKSERNCNANKKVKISNFVVKEKFNDGSSIINDTCLLPEENQNQEILCISNKTCDNSKNSNDLGQEFMEIDNTDKEGTTDSLKSTQSNIKSDTNAKLKESTNKKLENTQILLEELNTNGNTKNKTNQSENSSISSEPVQKPENDSSVSNKNVSKQIHESNKSENDKILSSMDKNEEQIQTEDKEVDCSIDLTATSDIEANISIETADLNKSKRNKRIRNKITDKSINEKSKRSSTPRPKIDAKEQERLEKEDQKRKEKEAKEQKKLQEKLERETKEQKRIQEKLEKEEMRRKEKDEKEKKRLLEIEAKNEEKRLKEEEKRKKEELKEEEKRKKEEERKKKEDEKKKKELEMEIKKRKAAEVFTKFFVPSRNSKVVEENISLTEKVDNNFMPFQIKEDMKLAPVARRFLNPEEKFAVDQTLDKKRSAPPPDLYLKNLKNNYQPLKSGRTLPNIEDDDEIIIIDEVHGTSQCIDANSKCSKKYRAKYLLFCENRRPPYYGTWRKKSNFIKPRKPFQTDKTIFDYEIDSDLEWEEEEPGESLSSSDNEKESEDEYEVDNEFFVPHGHLSDEELEEEEDQSPEVQKAKLKILQQEFASEMKKKTEKLKPRLIGVVWRNKDLSKPESCPTIVWEFLKKREMISNGQVKVVSQKENFTENNSPNQQDKPIKLLKRTELPEEYIKTLIKLVHGNRNNKLFIIKEFQAYLTKNNANHENVQFTKSCLREKIESMSQWKIMKNDTLKKKFLCYVVSKEYLDKYDLGDLNIQNKWEYIIPPKNIAAKDNLEEEETTTSSKAVKSIENSPVITKFAKILTKKKKQKLEENNEDVKLISNEKNIERKNSKVIQNNENVIKTPATPQTSSSTTLTTVASITKKRVPILFSVPRGQNVPEASKKIAVNDFLNQQSKNSQKSSPNKTISAFENDETIVIE